jgi:hypothetical protein
MKLSKIDVRSMNSGDGESDEEKREKDSSILSITHRLDAGRLDRSHKLKPVYSMIGSEVIV